MEPPPPLFSSSCHHCEELFATTRGQNFSKLMLATLRLTGPDTWHLHHGLESSENCRQQIKDPKSYFTSRSSDITSRSSVNGISHSFHGVLFVPSPKDGGIACSPLLVWLQLALVKPHRSAFVAAIDLVAFPSGGHREFGHLTRASWTNSQAMRA